MLTQVTRKLRSWGPVFDILPPNRVLALTVWFDPHDYYLCVCAKNWIQRVPSCWLACPLGDAAGYLGLSLPQAVRTPWPCWCLCPPPPASCLRKHRIILPLTAGVSSELWDAVFYTQLPIFSLYLVLSSVWWAASPWCLYSVILPCGPGSQGWSPAPWDLGRFSSFCLSFPFCTIGVVISVSPTEVKITVLFQTVECGSIMSHRNNLTVVLTKVSRSWGFPGGSAEGICLPVQKTWVRSLGREDPRRRKWQPTPVFWPGKSHGQRSLVDYSPGGRKRVRQLKDWKTTNDSRL